MSHKLIQYICNKCFQLPFGLSLEKNQSQNCDNNF